MPLIIRLGEGRVRRITAIVAVAIVTTVGSMAPALSAAPCIHSWAKPGKYTIQGKLNQRTQRTTAHLSNNCRVSFNLPGVFTGGPVKKAGACLRFTFKVQKQPQVFVARWCNSYAVVPWKGRDVRISVQRSRLK